VTPPDGATLQRQTAAPETAGEGVPATEVEPARYEVPYEPFEGSTSRVIVQATLNGVTAPMAIDTGAPGLIVSYGLAERLGLFSSGSAQLVVQAAGIGGSVPAIRTIVDSLSVGGARTTFVPTTVTGPLSESFEGLIGMDFLAKYAVSIDPQKNVLVLVENPPSRESRAGRDEAWWKKTFSEFASTVEMWKGHSDATRGKLGSKAQAFVDQQVREAERLLQRLHVYASDNAVPRHWR
jgi:hypothetical protein